jgi:integrase
MASKSKAGRFHVGSGLYRQVAETGSGSWLLRYERAGRERWMGMGSLKAFSLREAQHRARKAQQQVFDGVDPIDARREQRALEARKAVLSITFEEAAKAYKKQHEGKWTSQKHRDAFENSLETHTYPVIGKLPVAKIDTALVLRVVEPIWLTKNKTASRVRGRIEVVLDWCKVRGFREGDNPAKWDGHLSEVLAVGGDIGAVTHHVALPYASVPEFIAALQQRKGNGPRALEFIVLSASRTGEVLKAKWAEIDFENRIWTRPSSHMKGRVEHQVPLTNRMVEILKGLPREGGQDGFVFVGIKKNHGLGKMVLPKLVESLGANCTVHGFRSSFRDWAAEQTSFANDIIEMSLAHKTGGKVELAYKRTDLLLKRRKLMTAWEVFATSPGRTADVVPIGRAKEKGA